LQDRYFELDIMIDNLAKSIGVPNANCYFRLSNIRRPSREEYRRKVVEFMLAYMSILESFRSLQGYDELRRFVERRLNEVTEHILNGKNKDVEKRYEYYIMNE
jgi:hypothetical protein